MCGDGDSVYVRATSPQDEGGRVALSHIWGSKPGLTLKSTMPIGKEYPLRLQDLSATFRDAVIVTRGLGYRNLWIDSLCIFAYRSWRKYQRKSRFGPLISEKFRSASQFTHRLYTPSRRLTDYLLIYVFPLKYTKIFLPRELFPDSKVKLFPTISILLVFIYLKVDPDRLYKKEKEEILPKTTDIISTESGPLQSASVFGSEQPLPWALSTLIL